MGISRVPGILASAALAAVLSSAQGVGPKAGSTSGTAPGTSNGTGTTGGLPTGGLTGTRSPVPGATTTNPNGISRGTFFFGKVVMPDGTAPPPSVIIERVCGGSVHPQAYVDSRGNFSFQVGQTQDMIPDATTSRGSSPTPSSNQSSPLTSLFNCDLRASLAGYRSEAVTLAGRRNMDDPDIGTITLHRLVGVEGLTISATSALAPKDARKAYEKGLEAVKKSKIDEARTDFTKATDLYPRYASAWFELGRAYEYRSRIEEARDAYSKSIAADSKFVPPYEHLYLLSVKEEKWEEVASTTDRIMRLNPYDFPQAVYYNAVANLQLGKLDVAEKSAREAVTIDTGGKNPKVNYILGMILIRKQDLKGAAECLRTYLKSDAVTDRDRVTKMLAEIDKQVQAKVELKPEL